MRILVASKNKSKIEGTSSAFKKYFQNEIIVDGVPSESNVSEQPFNEDVIKGARNRVQYIKDHASDSYDYFVALESGCIRIYDKDYFVTYAIVNNGDKQSEGMSAGFTLSDELVKKISDSNLQNVMHEYFNKSAQDYEGGTVGLITENIIVRADLCEQAVVLALTKFINLPLWQI